MQLIVVSLDLNVHLPDVLKGLLSYAALRRRLEARLNDFLLLRALPTRFDAGGAVAVRIFEPYIVAFNSLPRVALVPLIVVMFGLGDLSKVITALTLVFFVVFFNTFEGTRSVDRDHINAARFLGATRWQITWTVYVPSALAWVFASLTPAISFALIGVIVGEFIGSERGLGKIIIESEAMLQPADMMVALLVLMVIGVVLVAVVRQIQHRLLRWQNSNVEKY
jgi:sulfonate transport system permease protein